MTSDARNRMIAGAARLLARRGLQATSFSTVLAATGAPRGSIYHHFPGGKDELVVAALDATERSRTVPPCPPSSARWGKHARGPIGLASVVVWESRRSAVTSTADE